MKWKCEALKVVLEDARLARYNIFFKEHTFLKLEVKTWQQKTWKRGVRWNELKGEFKGSFMPSWTLFLSLHWQMRRPTINS
jgi:hypothetical protein